MTLSKLPALLLVSLALAASPLRAQTDTPQAKAYLVSNAHLDSQWNWDVQKTISEYVPKTLFRNLMLIDKYPDYVFNFEGGVKYAWMKEYHPEAYARLRGFIQEGRWHISGSRLTSSKIRARYMATRGLLVIVFKTDRSILRSFGF